ncbi:hypothetical protein CHS0354_023578 [Potamilus streckersoni]|uniref:Uncharacterized protein n=1 Tax=Potamilus streckersoni TaxID=2493646 RepID=A0AAE0SYK8_9BIVA|nr:hypothetical protein CHS0354_023578 [Potamilus streckersoni]
MSLSPCGLCIIDKYEVEVTLPDDKKIPFQMTGETIEPSGYITTKRKCRSLVDQNKEELVYAGTVTDMKIYYWGTITLDGVEKSCCCYIDATKY